jgi:hypothetical protein
MAPGPTLRGRHISQVVKPHRPKDRPSDVGLGARSACAKRSAGGGLPRPCSAVDARAPSGARRVQTGMVRQRRARGLAAEEYGYPRHSKNDKPHAQEHPKVEPRRTASLIFGLLQRHHIHEGTLAAMLLGRCRSARLPLAALWCASVDGGYGVAGRAESARLPCRARSLSRLRLCPPACRR